MWFLAHFSFYADSIHAPEMAYIFHKISTSQQLPANWTWETLIICQINNLMLQFQESETEKQPKKVKKKKKKKKSR